MMKNHVWHGIFDHEVVNMIDQADRDHKAWNIDDDEYTRILEHYQREIEKTKIKSLFSNK